MGTYSGLQTDLQAARSVMPKPERSLWRSVSTGWEAPVARH